MRATEPIRTEHDVLLPKLSKIRDLADGIGEVAPEVLEKDLDALLHLLRHELVPHAEVEDTVLYPVVARLLGGRDATATMSRDHAEVVRFVHELEALVPLVGEVEERPDVARTLRRLLYGLDALVRLHFAKEEEIYLPLLDAELDEVAAADLLAELGHPDHGHLHHHGSS